MDTLNTLRHWLVDHFERRNIHGRSRWMNWYERRRFLRYSQSGLVLHKGRCITPQESFKNLALVAPTGSGKTTRYVIPNLLELQGSAVVTDPSGEIYRATAGHLKKQGFKVEVLQPANAMQSRHFNPLTYLDGHQELGELARTLAEYGNQGEGDSGSGGDSGAFWTHGAADILTIGLHALSATSDPSYRNLGNLRWMLNHFGYGGEGIAEFLGRHLDAHMQAEFMGFINQDRKVMASHLSTARAGLGLWSDPEICRLTADDDIGISQLRQRKTVLYLIVPENRIPYFSLILNLLYRACFRVCLEQWDENAYKAGALLPVYFFLDEFGNLGRIPHFDKTITTLRKRACSISVILQQPAQVEAVYGRKQAESILGGGCANKLYLAGLDGETAFAVERQLGQETIRASEGSQASRRLGKPLLRAEEVRRLPENRGILISGRKRPLYARLPACYELPRWKTAMTQPAPAFPKATTADPCFLPFGNDTDTAQPLVDERLSYQLADALAA
jgi:type IV secretory pathway TraG/TraD family ATPase VirD4